MTDEERYPPPYETEAVDEFRRTQLPAREWLRGGGLRVPPALRRARPRACRAGRRCSPGSTRRCTACRRPTGSPRRTPIRRWGWLDPDSVPTLGDWFRAGGYQTHYRGKWHVSPRRPASFPGTHEGLMASDDDGVVIPEAVEAYRKADRLDPFGFSGWIGREPHGADEGRLRHGARRGVRRAGGRAVRRAGGGRRRRPVAGGRLVRQPPRHRVRGRAVRRCARVRRRPTTPCPTSPRRRRRPTRSRAARRARSSSRRCGRR